MKRNFYIDESYKREILTSLTMQAVEAAGSESGGSGGREEWAGGVGAAGVAGGREWQMAGAESEWRQQAECLR